MEIAAAARSALVASLEREVSVRVAPEQGETGGALSAFVTEPNGLTATLAEDKNTVAAGGTVTYTLTLTNKTAAPVSISYSASAPGQPPATLVVRNAAGSALFLPAPGPPPIDTIALAPGQSLSSAQTVSSFGATGVYSASATYADSAVTTVGPLTVTVQ